MNSYEIKNISAMLNAEGEATGVKYKVVATDDKGEVAETARHAPMPMPFRDAELYSEEELHQVTVHDVEVNNVEEFLDGELVRQHEAIANPPPIDPAIPVLPPVLNEEQQRQAWFNSIDETIFIMQHKFTRFQMGYSKRLEAAQAFQAANFEGEPGIWITSFADAAGVTNQQSAESVLAKAAEYDVGLEKLEDLRMQKYLILRADTKEDAAAVYTDIIARATVIENSLS